MLLLGMICFFFVIKFIWGEYGCEGDLLGKSGVVYIDGGVGGDFGLGFCGIWILVDEFVLFVVKDRSGGVIGEVFVIEEGEELRFGRVFLILCRWLCCWCFSYVCFFNWILFWGL